MSKTGLAMISDTSEVFTDFLLRLDTSNMIETIRQITCMFDVIDASPKWRPQITSLALVPAKQLGECQRIGLLTWDFPNELRDISDPLDLMQYLPPWCRVGAKEALTLV
jgi:hypothetical protein